MKYVSAKYIKDLFQISGTTLQRWKENGNIKYKQISPKKILYMLPETSNDLLSYEMATIGFVSNDLKRDEMDMLNRAYKQLNPNNSISCFYDDSYENTDDPINKVNGEYSMLGKMLNNEVSCLILSKPITEYKNYSNLLFLIKQAVMKKVNIYIYDINDKSFKIYTNIDEDMLKTLPECNEHAIFDNNYDLSYIRNLIKYCCTNLQLVMIKSDGQTLMDKSTVYSMSKVFEDLDYLLHLSNRQKVILNTYFNMLLNPDPETCNIKDNKYILLEKNA